MKMNENETNQGCTIPSRQYLPITRRLAIRTRRATHELESSSSSSLSSSVVITERENSAQNSPHKFQNSGTPTHKNEREKKTPHQNNLSLSFRRNIYGRTKCFLLLKVVLIILLRYKSSSKTFRIR